MTENPLGFSVDGYLRYLSLRAKRGNPELWESMSNRRPAVYILTNKRNGTLYIGVTSNLPKRIDEHKSGRGSVFTTKYKLTVLIYVEYCEAMMMALEREKQLKAGSRKQKQGLIEKDNRTGKIFRIWCNPGLLRPSQ